jgi:16S rRNA (uracil1498-N3)-methyltransferase
MRLKAGDPIAVFDGRGHAWRARIAAASKAGVRAELLEPLPPASEPRVALTLAQAVLKGDHMDAVIRDATMMGAAAIAPILTARTIARVARPPGATAPERWRRVALASAKQCGRATLPDIASPTSVEKLIDRLQRESGQHRIVLAEPSSAIEANAGAGLSRASSAILAVGPEGGWSAEELARFVSAGFVALTLGRLTLRADAAALVGISVLRATWKDF